MREGRAGCGADQGVLLAAVSAGPWPAAGVTVSSLAQGRKKLINMEGISGPEHLVLEETVYDLSVRAGGGISDLCEAIDK